MATSTGLQCPFVMRINLASCKYPVLRVVQRQLGWMEVDDEAAHVHWCDTSAGTERLVRLARPQKLNHFPGMLEIARKKALARNLAAMRVLFPREYDFSPRAFLLPEMTEAFLSELVQGGQASASRRRGRRPAFILKLDNGSMGRGIKLVQTYSQAMAALPTFDHENVVACQYVDRPLLIDGKKFDLRIYVLVRCCNPLRIFLCREGLVRFCTERYEPPGPGNLGNAYAHLTNYAVNKANPAFVFNQDAQQSGTGSKWTITAFAQWMRERGHDFDALWAQIAHIVCKTLIAAQPMLQYQYDCATKADDDGLTCFELLGLDVLIDEDLRPWLLEVNHSPSLTTDTPLDLEIKSRLVREVLALAGVEPQRVRAELAAKERAKQARLYSSHAACVAPWAAAAAATPAGSGTSSGKGAKPSCTEVGEPSSCPTSHVLPELAAAPCADDAAAAASRSPCGGASPGPASATASLGAGCSMPGPAAGEPVRGSPQWEAAQRAYEDAHLGQFDRIMPSNDPERAALYDRLLGGALQVFYRSTMQGRNQQRLLQIRERRLQEEAEAVARKDALQRRAENLRAWMAVVCQRHREERLLRAAAAAAEGMADCAATDPASADGLDADSGSDSSMDGGHNDGSGAGARGAAAAAADAEAVALLQSHFTIARLNLPSSHGRQKQNAQRAAQRSDNGSCGGGCGPSGRAAVAARKQVALESAAGAWLSVSGMPVGAAAGQGKLDPDSGGASSTSGKPKGRAAKPRRSRSAGSQLSWAQSITIENVLDQRLAAAGAAAPEHLAAQAPVLPDGTSAELPSRPGSATLKAWAAAVTEQQGEGRQQVSGGAALLQQVQPPQPHPWQQEAWDACGRPAAAAQGGASSSSKFLQRVADVTQQQLAKTAPDVAPERLHSTSDASGTSSEHSGSDQDCAACSADGSVLSTSGDCRARGVPAPAICGMGGLPAQSSLSDTYIPPALLSALHTVRVCPSLLSGLRSGTAAGSAARTSSALPPPSPRQGSAPWLAARGLKRDLLACSSAAAKARPAGCASPGTRCAGAGQVALDLPLALASLQQASGGASLPPCTQPHSCKGSPGGAPASVAANPQPARPPAAQRGSRTVAARKSGQQGHGQASLPTATAKAGPTGPWTGGQQYRASIEEQAVRSVASLICDVMQSRGV